MNTDDLAHETLRRFAEDMERTTRQVREAALQAVVPAPSMLANLAAQWVIPEPQLHKLFEQTAFVPPSGLDAIAHEIIAPRTLSSQILDEMQPFFESAARVMRGCIDGAERLARSGWTLPVHMSPGEMLDLLSARDDDAIDSAFIAFYEEDGMGVGVLKNHVFASSRLKEWQPLLAQCFDNYVCGRYLICIPALLSVLEGGLARREGATFVRTDDRVAYFKAKMQTSTPDSLNQAMWKSMNTFIATLYEKSNFDSARRPVKLNRHWILHGRDLPSAWRQADALRLFHALSTLCTLCR
jgi:hypothetical protein